MTIRQYKVFLNGAGLRRRGERTLIYAPHPVARALNHFDAVARSACESTRFCHVMTDNSGDACQIPFRAYFKEDHCSTSMKYRK